MANFDDLEDNEIESDQPAAADPAAVAAPAPKPINPTVAQYLKSKQDLAAAQQKSAESQLISGLARAGGMFANSAYGSTKGVDEGAFNALDKAAQAPVDNVLAAQKAEGQELSNESALRESQQKGDAEDPNSKKSQAVKAMIQKLYPGKFTDEQLAPVSAADAEQYIYKPIELDQKVQERKQTHADATASRDDKKQEAAMTSTIQQLEQTRQSPAVAQAEKDIYAASKVKSLANLYGDPNNLNPQMVKTLIAEVGKIAAGGQSSESELNYLTPTTLTGKLAGIWQQLTNSPTPANAGAFIKQYQDYANALTKDAQEVIKDKYGRIIDSRSDQLGDANMAKLTKNYIHRFDVSSPSGNAPEETVNMIGPDNKIHAVKKSLVKDALAHGGKMADGG